LGQGGSLSLLLAIETSCDETAVALLGSDGRLLASELHSQVDLHRKWGGVVPEIASRAHCEALPPMVDRVLERAGARMEAVGRVAATVMPGLIGPLLIGTTYARTLAWGLGIPGRGVHHIQGHIFAPWSEGGAPQSPFVALVASGGHTELHRVVGPGRYQRLGCTRDDAAGEAFDKVAKLLGLGYPGGPVIDRLAERGDPKRWPFPRGMRGRGLDLSFSGLKTAVRRHVQKRGLPTDEAALADVCASLQDAIVDSLVEKTLAAVEETGLKDVVVTGGVAANRRLRQRMQEACEARGLDLKLPEPRFCTDNAAMIGRAAWLDEQAGVPPLPLEARASQRLDRALST
jgi:N6-L-threonylcarbamoyladenine synthase